jgi:hypothetical protein
MTNRREGTLQGFVLLILLFAISWKATDALSLPAPDGTDEAEWTAISVVHYRQLGGERPPGAELDVLNGKVQEDPWRQGVQATTFGWPNPGFHKWIWGAACSSVAPESIDPLLFFRYNRGDQREASEAIRPLAAAIERARLLVAAISAACAVLIFLIARNLGGWLAGSVAMAGWLFHPLVREWSHMARPDLGMVLLLLGCLACLILGAPAIRGDLGPNRRRAMLLALGLLAGLCTATKLNGALAPIFVALSLPLIFPGSGGSYPWKKLLVSWIAVGAIATLTLIAWFPYLWSHPLDHFSEVLAFWEKHMGFQQERWEASGGVVSRALSEQVDLAVTRLGFDHEPVRATTRVPGGPLWICAGMLAALTLALRRVPERARSARVLIVAVLVTVIGTTLWLPLDWARYYFASVALILLVESTLIGYLVDLVSRRLEPRVTSEPASTD